MSYRFKLEDDDYKDIVKFREFRGLNRYIPIINSIIINTIIMDIAFWVLILNRMDKYYTDIRFLNQTPRMLLIESTIIMFLIVKPIYLKLSLNKHIKELLKKNRYLLDEHEVEFMEDYIKFSNSRITINLNKNKKLFIKKNRKLIFIYSKMMDDCIFIPKSEEQQIINFIKGV